jgi:hypothetical protein
LGWYAIAWIEHFLVHGPGDVQGKRIELDDEFAAFILKAYDVDEDGARFVRRAFLSRAKGRSKSGVAAMVECFEALGECRFDHWAKRGETSDWGYRFSPGEPVGKQLAYVEVINVATEEQQAGNTYDAVYYMLHSNTCSSELLERYGKIDVGLTRTYLPGRRGFIQPVSASNESNDGAKSTFIVSDETHLWVPPVTGVHKLGRMHQTMCRNLLKRAQASGWMLETSTMYAKGEGSVAEGTHAYARSLKSAGRESSLLFDHKQAAEHWDLNQRDQRVKALKEAYGPAAAWMNLEAIADYWDDPQASENEFRRFWLNQPVRLKNPLAIDPMQWLLLEDRELEQPTRAALVVAVSAHTRATSAIGVAWEVKGGRTGVMVESQRGVKWVAGRVEHLMAKHDIIQVGLATGEARLLQPDLVRKGIEFERDGLGRRLNETDITASCGAFQEAVKSALLAHLGQNELNAGISGARTRPIGKAETWDAETRPEVIAVAAAFYQWGLLGLDTSYAVLDSVC